MAFSTLCMLIALCSLYFRAFSLHPVLHVCLTVVLGYFVVISSSICPRQKFTFLLPALSQFNLSLYSFTIDNVTIYPVEQVWKLGSFCDSFLSGMSEIQPVLVIQHHKNTSHPFCPLGESSSSLPGQLSPWLLQSLPLYCLTLASLLSHSTSAFKIIYMLLWSHHAPQVLALAFWWLLEPEAPWCNLQSLPWPNLSLPPAYDLWCSTTLVCQNASCSLKWL